MKFLLLTLLLGVGAVVAVSVFNVQLNGFSWKDSAASTSSQTVTPNNTRPEGVRPPTTSRVFPPLPPGSGFHGPSGPPGEGFKGPTEQPPDY